MNHFFPIQIPVALKGALSTNDVRVAEVSVEKAK